MPVPPGTYNYYLAPWVHDIDPVGNIEHWRLPTGAIAGVDMRNIPDQSVQGGTPHGYAFVAIDPAAPVPDGGIFLSNDLNTQPDDRIAAEQVLGLSSGDLAGVSVVDGEFAALTEYADMTGDNLVKPLMPGAQSDGSFEIRLHLKGHSIIKSERYNKGRHGYVEDVLKYRVPILKQRFGQKNAEEDFWVMERDYGIKIGDLVKGEISRRPGTTRTDTFTEGSDTDLSSHTNDDGDSWTQQTAAHYTVLGASDVVERSSGGSTWEWARVDYDFSGDNLNSQIDVITTDSQQFGGAMIRKANDTAETLYHCSWVAYTASTTSMRFRKIVTGTTTTFDTAGNNGYGTATFRVELDAVTDALEVLVDGNSESTQTDSAIDGNTVGGKRAGIEYFSNKSATPFGTMDNWAGTDGISAGGLSIPIAAYHSRLQQGIY